MAPRRVLYFAENALSTIQGGGIVTYAVLKGLPPERLLGFFLYRNITPAPEYADRFVYLGPWRTPAAHAGLNRLTGGATTEPLRRLLTDRYVENDFAFVRQRVDRESFVPELVYFSGLSYRTLRLAVMAAEHYDVPMAILHMDDWMAMEERAAGRWSGLWRKRITEQMTRAAARSVASTSNSPRLAARLTSRTGYRHVSANNCCSDLRPLADTRPLRPNRIPIITYAGAMNRELQGETLKVLASAVAELNAEGTRVHLHIYTPWEFAPDANAVSVPHAVFYKGQVGRDKLAEVYRRSDFLVTTVTYRECNIPYFRHSLSTKLSEYLCMGKPVISMGHFDWHLHEYVQDNGCGFSILMDEDFSRARIKEQLRGILATDRALLDDIGVRNRQLWERAHDVDVMARDTRRAVGMGDDEASAPADALRGVVWVGAPAGSAEAGWVPVSKLKAICRRLVDVFDHRAVDLVGPDPSRHPDLGAVLAYCGDIGLHAAIVRGHWSDTRGGRVDPAGARWSLAPAQRSVNAPLAEAMDVFAQVAALRGGSMAPSTPTQRAINQLTVRVSDIGDRKTRVWVCGSAAVGLSVLQAIADHPWLRTAVEACGFLSSPGHCQADTLHGFPWRPLDHPDAQTADLIVVTSEISRLAIQEALLRLGLHDRAVAIFGLRGTARDTGYERVPSGPGQMFCHGLTARDYAAREIAVRTARVGDDAWIDEQARALAGTEVA